MEHATKHLSSFFPQSILQKVRDLYPNDTFRTLFSSLVRYLTQFFFLLCIALTLTKPSRSTITPSLPLKIRLRCMYTDTCKCKLKQKKEIRLIVIYLMQLHEISGRNTINNCS